MNGSSRAIYIISKTQNILIQCCAEKTISKIIPKIQAAEIYSIMFDKITDVSNISQLCLLLRYTDCEGIHESFLKFIDIRANYFDTESRSADNEEPEMTGIQIGELVSQELKNHHNLDPKNMVGTTTDGCAAMISEVRGAVSTTHHEAINAVYCPCYNHALNLSVSQTSKIQDIKKRG